MNCPRCGFPLPDRGDCAFCPDCGQMIDYSEVYPEKKGVKAALIVVLVVLLLAIAFLCFYIFGGFDLFGSKKRPPIETGPAVSTEDSGEESGTPQQTEAPTTTAPETTTAPDSTTEAEPTTESETAEESTEADKGFILPESDKKALTKADIENLSKDELRIARNEIFARHGRKFADENLQKYFDEKPWYHGTIEQEAFSMDSLNSIEKANLDLIMAREDELGA